MPDANSTVLVVDDDPDLRASVGRLLRSLGINTQLFASIPDFLKSDPPDGPTCLVLDVRLPGRSGLDLQRELAAANRELPIIFITGHGDIPMSVQAMKGGAIEFLTKPFNTVRTLEYLAVPSVHLDHFGRCGALGPLAPIDVDPGNEIFPSNVYSSALRASRNAGARDV
jgi:FixJ family two-component response regulator